MLSLETVLKSENNVPQSCQKLTWYTSNKHWLPVVSHLWI